MKKVYVIILILLFFALGFFVSKIYFTDKEKPDSGVYNELSFQSLRKEGNDYYLKFSKQEEEKVFPEYCYQNGVFVENFDNDCVIQGRPLQDKINPEIDLSKEYKISKDGVIELITYDNGPMTFSLTSISSYYKYINDKDYELNSDITRDPKAYNFEVFMLNGEIINLRQIYQE